MEAALEQVNLRLTQHCVNNEEPSFQASNLHEISDRRQQECQAYLTLSYRSKHAKLGSFIHIFLSAQQSRDVIQVFLLPQQVWVCLSQPSLLGIHLFPDGLIKSMSPGEPGKVTLC